MPKWRSRRASFTESKHTKGFHFCSIDADGSIHLKHNRTRTQNRWIRVQLAGVKSLKLAQDAEVEIKAGKLYRKQAYEGLPLLFDRRRRKHSSEAQPHAHAEPLDPGATGWR